MCTGCTLVPVLNAQGTSSCGLQKCTSMAWMHAVYGAATRPHPTARTHIHTCVCKASSPLPRGVPHRGRLRTAPRPGIAMQGALNLTRTASALEQMLSACRTLITPAGMHGHAHEAGTCRT